MVCAKDFLAGFTAEYDAARRGHTDAAWADAWCDRPPGAWTRLMIKAEDAVMRSVAPRLGLTCVPGEPLHYDAVFIKGGAERWERFPILVAIEHENSWGTFHGEIAKLLTIRCPLKVGVTYLPVGDGRTFDMVTGTITRHIENWFGLIKRHTAEDPAAEYLFVIGREVEPLKLEWYALAFRASDGPQGPSNRSDYRR
jgi:hypothetical protein